MKRRVFVAIRYTLELQEKALAWQQGQPTLGQAPIRWIAGKNLHITLVPPWYEEDVEKVTRGLRQLQKHKAFDIALSTIGFGPSRQPRLIWATGEATEEILELQKHVASALGAHNDGQFKLHMTLARFRPEDFASFPIKRLNERIDWKMTVSSIVLMESHLSSTGADYEVLEEIKFAESP